jgi:hypothetical protein
LEGRKPSKMKLSVGSPEMTKEGMKAVGPGIGMMGIFSFNAFWIIK